MPAHSVPLPFGAGLFKIGLARRGDDMLSVHRGHDIIGWASWDAVRHWAGQLDDDYAAEAKSYDRSVRAEVQRRHCSRAQASDTLADHGVYAPTYDESAARIGPPRSSAV